MYIIYIIIYIGIYTDIDHLLPGSPPNESLGMAGFGWPLRSQPLLLPTQPDNHRASPFRRSSLGFLRDAMKLKKTCQPINCQLILVV